MIRLQDNFIIEHLSVDNLGREKSNKVVCDNPVFCQGQSWQANISYNKFTKWRRRYDRLQFVRALKKRWQFDGNFREETNMFWLSLFLWIFSWREGKKQLFDNVNVSPTCVPFPLSLLLTNVCTLVCGPWTFLSCAVGIDQIEIMSLTPVKHNSSSPSLLVYIFLVTI